MVKIRAPGVWRWFCSLALSAFLTCACCVSTSQEAPEFHRFIHTGSQNVSTSSWMYDLRDAVYSHSLEDITLPGTHDSGAFALADVLSPYPDSSDLDLTLLLEIAKVYHLSDVYAIARKWSLAQTGNFYDQLRGGIRFLDLRCYFNGSEWVTGHTLLGTPVRELLRQVAAFLEESSGEVVVIQATDRSARAPSADIGALAQIVTDELGHIVIPTSSSWKQPIGDLVSQDQRVLFTFDNSSFFEAFGTVAWPDSAVFEGRYTDQDRLQSMLDANRAHILAEGGRGKLDLVYYTLTPRGRDIVDAIVYHNATQSLLDLASVANAQLPTFAASNRNMMLGNALLVDRFMQSDVVDIAVRFAARRCHDNASVRARRPDGQDCRSWWLAGSCKDKSITTQCALTCGIC